MKKNRVFLLALVALLGFGTFAACGDNQTNSSDSSESNVPGESESVDNGSSGGDVTPEVHYGLPVAATGYYIKDADIIGDDSSRVLLYTTNGESAEEDNVLAIRSATKEADGWLYGDETIAVTGTVDAWDEFIGSGSIVKGSFSYGNESYQWLIAYSATTKANESQNEIGLAVAKEVGGEWTKVSSAPLIAFDETVYGTGSAGCYAPSLVNLNGESKIRIYYTYADAYGHFAQFVDIDASNLDKLYTEEAKKDVNLISGTVQLPTNGNLSGGDAALMFPNADFAHDATTGTVYAVKDYSPSAATTPNYAEKIELGWIAEAEFYTAEVLAGWKSLRIWDFSDTPDMAYERLYSAAIVSDYYGKVNGATALEVVYNVCEIEIVEENWMFTQNLVSVELSLTDSAA